VTVDKDDPLKTDLQLEFPDGGDVDLAWTGGGAHPTVSGTQNLIQALTLRLLVYRNEIAGLGHPRYGSRVRELVGQPLTRPNLDLLRRHVRAALKEEPRVREIVAVHVTPRLDAPGAVDVAATVRAVTDDLLEVSVALDLR
jgi:phage baseplate assembly protein W